MNKLALSVLALAALSHLQPAAPQKRMTPKETNFKTVMTAAQGAWDKGQYGRCLEQLREAMSHVIKKRAMAILAALPTAPEGYSIKEETDLDAMQKNPIAASMGSALGSTLARTYLREDGSRVRVSVVADSPLVKMVSMWLSNPAMLEKGSELISYNEHNAVLKTRGKNLNMQILISEAHICEVQANGLSEEELFALFDQKTVDALAKALDH